MNQIGFVPRHPPPPWPASVSFTAERGDFSRLVTRGAALELVTFGFYRFWLTTDIRRHLWANTVIDGDLVEYTGRGKELLIGFLFALAILVPIYLAYFVITIEAERLKGFASIPLLLAFYTFGQFATYRARRYRVTRTVWRGVRFWMDGSGWAYAGRALLWGLAAAVTLGLALPWREAALERYKMQHSRYGDLQGKFEGRGWDFFKRVWWLMLLAPVALVLFPAAPFAYAEYKAREWSWWLSGIRFGGVRVQSTLPNNALYGLYWKVIGWSSLLAVIMAIYEVYCDTLVSRLSGATFEQTLAGDSLPRSILIGMGYFAWLLSINVVLRLHLLRDLWAKISKSVQVHGVGAAENVSARGELASALGEGFADGLDVAGF